MIVFGVYVICYMLHFICYMLYVIRYMLYVTHRLVALVFGSKKVSSECFCWALGLIFGAFGELLEGFWEALGVIWEPLGGLWLFFGLLLPDNGFMTTFFVILGGFGVICDAFGDPS